MASWFRSMDMQYVSIIVNEDAAHSCIKLIGQIGNGAVQFTDLNEGLTAFQRRFVSNIRRCDELDRKLKYFMGEIAKFNLSLTSPGSVDEFVKSSGESATAGEPSRSGLHLLERLESELERLEGRLVELNKFHEQMSSEYSMKFEMQELLLKAQELTQALFLVPSYQQTRGGGGDGPGGGVGEVELGGGSGSAAAEARALLGDQRLADMRFSTISGVLPEAEKARFERTIFRSTRGNCLAHFMDMESGVVDPVLGSLQPKVAFLIMYKGATIEAKLRRICDAFGARTYQLPDLDDKDSVRQLVQENAQEMKESRLVCQKNYEQRFQLCSILAQNVLEWSWRVRREKAIYHTLNMFKADINGMLRAEGWVVESFLDRVRGALNRAHSNMDHGMPSLLESLPRPWPTPPTHFETNKFTYPFQEFVDTYGVPRYKEANPALFTAVTFPFLFGVMYGDIGHGSLILLASAFLVFKERSMEGVRMNEMMGGVFSARYMLLLMGAFAVYVGFCYNDFFALGLALFPSEYEWDDGLATAKGTVANRTCDYGDPDCVYQFGVDPAWHISSNELLFFNSLKMKLSVVLGIVQMTLGIFLKGLNALYFKENLDFYLEFIPMIIFDMAFFGYMVLLIFMKWSIDWNQRMYMATCNEDNDHFPACAENPSDYTVADLCPLNFGGSTGGCQPPNLITTLMNMALMPGNVAEPMYPGQSQIQLLLLLLAGASVPVLLCGKPLMLSQAQHAEAGHTAAASAPPAHAEEHDLIERKGHAHGEGQAQHDFSEIMIHQAIETIEFVLGMVSNTASYLRLWALSLAHTELAAVFWEKAMLATINMNNPVAILVGYSVFAAVTFAVLLAMDVLECFLHALRLHWVEFQNKFYKADGHNFQPFHLAPILKAC
uniref:V-type proton ATPase subunit a n=1 Tax=Rhizochromulina marina TaxID=1034831 RepID=A0A7S2RLT6_9STRA|mmetsp:Transcript_18151/g.53048  ORF Transcript_18151/g.53048 Transcript_18151/m.53048 type:complete len:891 (+) Transcript_18151:208-2880(+)